MTVSGHSISPLRPPDDTHTYELNNNVATETKDTNMKKLLLLALALTASLASAQSYGHAAPAQWSHEHRDHHYSHGYRPAPSFGCLPSAPAGYWTTQSETVFVPASFVAALNTCGQTQLTFVPSHFETINRQVWVARSW